jgi:four helix bundle protein
MRSSYKALDAYQRAVSLADSLHAAIRNWPWLDQRSVGLQLLRSADSVGANIAEAAGRWSKAERRRLLLTARGSLYETEHWIDRAQARHLELPDTAGRLDAIARPLSGLIKKHT